MATFSVSPTHALTPVRPGNCGLDVTLPAAGGNSTREVILGCFPRKQGSCWTLTLALTLTLGR